MWRRRFQSSRRMGKHCGFVLWRIIFVIWRIFPGCGSSEMNYSETEDSRSHGQAFEPETFWLQCRNNVQYYWKICRAWAVQECRILNCSSVWASYVRLGYGSGDLLTSRKPASASESDVLCGHRAVVCPDSKSASGWSACCVSLGQRHSESSVIQKWPFSVSRCPPVTAVKVPHLSKGSGCSWSSIFCHLWRFPRHVAPRDVTSPYLPPG